ncbi:MAG TPA: hypothetical protein VFX68_05080 [Sulfuricurvum sp.]|nr:hypothetical protein [Sulfuricurvum sp.]
MIKLIALFLTLSVANAQTLTYMLPDDKALFEQALIGHLKKANKEVIILTPMLHYDVLRTQLIRTIKNGINLTIIAQNPAHDSLKLVAYRNVELYSYHPRPLSDTLIVIDDTVCHLSGALDEEELLRKTQNILCSDEAELRQGIQKNIAKTLTRSKLYLK